MADRNAPQDGALPFSDVTGLLSAAASAEKQQALVARIYPAPPTDPASSSSALDRFAQLSLIAAQLRSFVKERSHSSPDLGVDQYIWHREPPAISIVNPPASSRPSTSKQAAQPAHVLFHLRTGGECMEDEWFATQLLLRASSELAEHALCISIEDEDGQFLLIEAAEHLPDWVTPEAVVNRVWIHHGHLHLVSPHHGAGSEEPIPIARAVELVSDASVLTRAPDDVEAAAVARAYEYPSAASSSHHSTLVYLPRQVAQALEVEPQLIANCVAAIQSRDPLSARSASRLVRFPPPPSSQPSNSASGASSSANDVVLTRVRMTRHLYAQLLHDRFFPPRQLGPHWQAAVERYRLHIHRPASAATQPKVQDEAQIQSELSHGRWYDLGAKIWCGLEMACTESASRRTRTGARSTTHPQDAISQEQRQKLVASLEKLGYFQGEIAGSAKWKALEEQALSQYASTSTPDASTDEPEPVCDVVDRILAGAGTGAPILNLAMDAPLAELRLSEDDDGWLQLSAAEIEAVLSAKSGTQPEAKRAVDEEDAFQRLGAFNDKLDAFLHTKSDERGAVFADEAEAMLDDELLFEDPDDEDDEDDEGRVRAEVEQRLARDGDEEKRKLLDRLLPRLSDADWLRPAAPPSKGVGFVESIDAISASRSGPPASSEAEGSLVVGNHLGAAEGELRRRLAAQYMRETSELLSSQGHAQIDGADDSDGELEQESEPEVRRRRAAEYDLEPDAADAVDTADGEVNLDGEVDVEAWDESTEVGNLLEFARISLGLSAEQYAQILEDRAGAGRFVPPAVPRERRREAKQEAKLDSFEAVMAAMDRSLNSLSKARKPTDEARGSPMNSTKAQREHARQEPGRVGERGGGGGVEVQGDEVDMELLTELGRGNGELPASLERLLGAGDGEIAAAQLEAYLRSLAAQPAAAATGPVEQLMRRFGLGSLPADQDPSSQL